jgi:enhancing lycopene biosynthesis protein 2
MRRIGVLLSGCGRYDGSEIHETVLLLLALRRRGWRVVFLAPDVEQADVVSHATGEVSEPSSSRRVLDESARLARGVVRDVAQVAAAELDGLVIPGGAGVVKNLCLEGPGPLGGGALRPELRRLLDDLASRGAPLAAVGLAEVVLARHQDRPLSDAAMTYPPEEVVIDAERNVLFTPGLLSTDDLERAARGIERLVEELARRVAAHPGTP